MAVIVKCAAPAALLAAIKKAIDDDAVATWAYDQDGDMTHTPDQWKSKAWMRPGVAPGILTFGIVPNSKVVLTDTIYGVYHGRLIEMLLTHFSSEFTEAAATANYLAPPDIKP